MTVVTCYVPTCSLWRQMPKQWQFDEKNWTELNVAFGGTLKLEFLERNLSRQTCSGISPCPYWRKARVLTTPPTLKLMTTKILSKKNDLSQSCILMSKELILFVCFNHYFLKGDLILNFTGQWENKRKIFLMLWGFDQRKKVNKNHSSK